MTSDDVVASLKRWMDMAPRGKARRQGDQGASRPRAPNAIVITLKRPYAPLLAHLALPNGFAAIMAKDSIATPLTQFVGTGPYMFKERKPDQYVQLVRFDGYSARKRAGERLWRQARGAARRAALRPGSQRQHARRRRRSRASTTSPTCCRSSLRAAREARPTSKPVLTAPFGFPYLVLNTKQGPLANMALRQAVQASLNDARHARRRLRRPEVLQSPTPTTTPKNTPFYSTAGTEHYGKGDAKKAAALAAAAKYDGDADQAS